MLVCAEKSEQDTSEANPEQNNSPQFLRAMQSKFWFLRSIILNSGKRGRTHGKNSI